MGREQEGSMRQLMIALGVASALALAGLAPSASAQTVYNPPGTGEYNPSGTGYTTYNPPGYGPYNPPGTGMTSTTAYYNPPGYGYGNPVGTGIGYTTAGYGMTGYPSAYGAYGYGAGSLSGGMHGGYGSPYGTFSVWGSPFGSYGYPYGGAGSPYAMYGAYDRYWGDNPSGFFNPPGYGPINTGGFGYSY
jgi:hypothetical protein